MAKQRKTFSVEAFKVKVNNFLLNSPDNCIDKRQAHMSMVENILMDSNNYKGFNYLTKKMMFKSELGTTIGINTYDSSEKLAEMQANNTLFNGTDKTRVFYY